MKKIVAVILTLALCLSFAACGPANAEKTITVGATPAPHAQILEVIKEVLAEDGYTLKIVEFDDYIQPNLALKEGELDANYFQHITYMNNFNEEYGISMVSAAAIHYEPIGIYAGKSSDLKNLPDGAKIAVPNDATNEARALLLLEQEGLIKLKECAGIAATKADIVDNPHNYEIVETKAELLTATRADVDVAVINGNYAIDAGLKIADALAVEASDGIAAEAYANVITVMAGNENSAKIQALVKALQSQTVKDYIEETYQGAVVALG